MKNNHKIVRRSSEVLGTEEIIGALPAAVQQAALTKSRNINQYKPKP